MAKPPHQVVHTAEPRYKREVTLEVVPVPEALRSQWTTAEVISLPEVLAFDNVVRWTRAVSPFGRHKNICKSQSAVMTL
jgi:hypothetical protein